MIRNKEIKKLVIFLTAVCILFAVVLFNRGIWDGVLFLAAYILACYAFYIFSRDRYKKIAKLSENLSRIAAGDINLDVRDNTEGELSILRNEIYKLTSKLTEQASNLEKEKNSLSSYLFDISHQLKTPLTSISIMSELLEDENLPPEKHDEFLKNIRTGLFRMEWLVLSLLKMAKLDANTINMQKRICRTEEIATLAAQALSVIAASKGQTINFEGDMHTTVLCDFNWTVEALSNIIKNALEHTKENGQIKISWNENPLAVLIVVEDEGGGISDKDMPNLFHRFYRGAGSPKENAGIGLALSLSIMRGQDGNIEVENKKGRGSVFILKFYKTSK